MTHDLTALADFLDGMARSIRSEDRPLDEAFLPKAKKLGEAASALRRLAVQDKKPPPAAGWNEAIDAAKKIAHGYDDDVYEDEDMNAVRRQVVKFIARDIEALRTTPAATKSADVGVGVPCGYALVPIKPTSEMIEAGCEHNPTQWNEGTDLGFAADVANDVYVAMVRSALSKPAPVAANASAEARLREALQRITGFIRDFALYDQKYALESVLMISDEALSAHTHASDCDKQGCMGDASPGDAKDLQELLSKPSALEPSDHTADCDKQGRELTKREQYCVAAALFASGTVVDETLRRIEEINENRRNAAINAGNIIAGNPSDRTADVTVDELHAFILKHGDEWEDEGVAARALLDTYGMWMR